MDDAQIARAIRDAVHRRGAGKTICPSDVARALADDWRPLMADVHRVAHALADQGALVVMQKGQVVDAARARGPVRLGVPDGTAGP